MRGCPSRYSRSAGNLKPYQGPSWVTMFTPGSSSRGCSAAGMVKSSIRMFAAGSETSFHSSPESPPSRQSSISAEARSGWRRGPAAAAAIMPMVPLKSIPFMVTLRQSPGSARCCRPCPQTPPAGIAAPSVRRTLSAPGTDARKIPLDSETRHAPLPGKFAINICNPHMQSPAATGRDRGAGRRGAGIFEAVGSGSVEGPFRGRKAGDRLPTAAPATRANRRE